MIAVQYSAALPADWQLRPEAAAVFTIELDGDAASSPSERDLLDEGERVRAARFQIPLLQRRYIAAHAALRRVLARALSLAPERVPIGVRSDGKPTLAGELAGALWFNLSHSAGVAVVALSAIGELGVDVEEIHRLPDADDVAERVFTAGERAAIERASSTRCDRAFFAAWTRKEAYIKATGEGLRAPLLDIQIDPESSSDERAVLHGRGASTSEVGWRVLDLELVPGFAAALAAPRGTAAVECYPYAAADLRSRAESGAWCSR
ncbi:MAG: 4'-phosphopantetheinyl transferase superfamily protein [Planctomycetes bacterium]|nr:4'-phosphopantetheinyl transferase superfamily protein [Planctomycetota bacterium]